VGLEERMSRAAVNFILDSCLFVLFLSLLTVTATLRVVFPSGPQAAGWTLWGGTFEAWHAVQFWLTAAMAGAVGLHLILHWTWVCGFVAARIGKWRGVRVHVNEATNTLYGVCLLIGVLTLLVAVVAAAELSIQRPASESTRPALMQGPP